MVHHQAIHWPNPGPLLTSFFHIAHKPEGNICESETPPPQVLHTYIPPVQINEKIQAGSEDGIMSIGVTPAHPPVTAQVHGTTSALALSRFPSIEPEVPKTIPDSSLKTQTTKEPEHPTRKGNYNKAQGDSAEARYRQCSPRLAGSRCHQHGSTVPAARKMPAQGRARLPAAPSAAASNKGPDPHSA